MIADDAEANVGRIFFDNSLKRVLRVFSHRVSFVENNKLKGVCICASRIKIYGCILGKLYNIVAHNADATIIRCIKLKNDRGL